MTKDTHEYQGGIAHLLTPVHPGGVLADELQARSLTSNALALALRLGRYLGTGSQLWVNLQAQYDLAVAQQEYGAQVEREVSAA